MFQCFLDLSDDPSLAQPSPSGPSSAEDGDAALAGLSAAEKKKAKQAMRKVQHNLA